MVCIHSCSSSLPIPFLIYSANDPHSFSVYGHVLQERRGYSQIHVNALSISAGVSMYVLVPIFGYLADTSGPGLASLLGGTILGLSYAIAAWGYRSGIPSTFGGDGLPFWVMVAAFIGVGAGTGCMYFSGLTLCEKNFGRGGSKGKAISTPIAAFGLSAMCFSQIASRLLYEVNPDGSRGDVDVFKFFVFLSLVLAGLGLGGFFVLVVIDDDEAGPGDSESQDPPQLEVPMSPKDASLLGPETVEFLQDKSMWLLAIGFLLVTGPSETFINNLGSIIRSLYPGDIPSSRLPTSTATHVSTVALSSTISRLAVGVITDMVSPTPQPIRLEDDDEGGHHGSVRRRNRTVSRVVWLILSALILALGHLILASGAAQSNSRVLSLVSVLFGCGYGASFALVPIIISTVWGSKHFGTNWGIVAMAPAVGAALWGFIYANNYGSAVDAIAAPAPTIGAFEIQLVTTPEPPILDRTLCYGVDCYARTFWLMMFSPLVASLLWAVAWKGPGGWQRRGLAV